LSKRYILLILDNLELNVMNMPDIMQYGMSMASE